LRQRKADVVPCAVRFVPLVRVTSTGASMLTIAIVVFVLWLLGMFFFKAAKGFIHLLLLIAVIIVLVHFFGGR
jgi:hypothetical protein